MYNVKPLKLKVSLNTDFQIDDPYYGIAFLQILKKAKKV